MGAGVAGKQWHNIELTLTRNNCNNRPNEAWALMQWLKLPAWKVGDRGFEPHSGLQISKKQSVSSLLTSKNSLFWGNFRDREVACSASDRQGSNFESWVWRTVSSHSFHYSQEVLLAYFSPYVHKGGLKPHLFHFISIGVIKHSKPMSYIHTLFLLSGLCMTHAQWSIHDIFLASVLIMPAS